MKLRRLAIERLPGIADGFELDDIGDGVQVITGPNGIGKSSLCRAARALLWPEQAPAAYTATHAVFEWEGRCLRVERDGSRHRWQADGIDVEPPPLPPGHLDGCYFPTLHELLDPSERAGADLAHRIRLQMSGGFDIDAVAEKLFGGIGPRHGQGERRKLDQAEKQLRQAFVRQRDLSEREARIDELKRARDEASSAAQRLEHLDRAIELAHSRNEHEQVLVELRALPDACGVLTGTELDDLKQRELELEAKRTQRREAEIALRAAEEDAARTRLEEPIDPAPVAACRQRADTLSRLEIEIAGQTEIVVGLRGAVAEASRNVGGAGIESRTFDLAGASDLFRFLRDATRARVEREAVAERLRILEGVRFTDDDQRRLDLLQDGAGALRTWLRSPDPGAGRDRRRSRALAFAGAALVALGAGLAFAGVPILAAASVAAGVAIAAAVALLGTGTAASPARDTARTEFPPTLASPASWSPGDVAAQLREIEREAASLEGLKRHAAFAEADRAKLEDRRAELDEEIRGLQPVRESLAAALGLEEIPPDAELVDTAQALDRLRVAVQAEREGTARLRALEERYRTGLGALAAEIARHGEAEPADAPGARAAIDQLDKRSAELRQARERIAAGRAEIDRVAQDLERVEEVISGIYRQRDLEPGDRAGLERLLDGLERYRELRRRQDLQAEAIRSASAKLEAAGEIALADRQTVWLVEERERLAACASRREALEKEIWDIEKDIASAREHDDVESALAAREECRARLGDARAEALRAAAGRLLLDRVKHEHEANQMPRVLERTRELFAGFTHHAYELRIASDGGGSFVSVETGSGEARRPDQLSAGTRVQLLLAARLAFASHAEGGLPLPLFLDEALDQSDPDRFRAIARSLGRIAADEDRQIFYLTSDPSDATRIRQALEEEGCEAGGMIDLAAVRGRGVSVTDPASLRIEAPRAVPSPAGMTPEEYGAALGIAPLDPRRTHRAQHLFHLAWDDLELLHGLLADGIETVGQWELLSRNAAPSAARARAGSAVGAQLDDRARLLEAFCEAWREGRGRPVTREAIESSGAVSGRYLDQVAEIAAELDGNPERLLETLRTRGDERLRGFRRHSADELEAYLGEIGCIDPRPVLTQGDAITRLLMVPVTEHLPDGTVAGCVHRWWALSG